MIVLRAYPRRWRERYGDELVALLEAEPLTWRVRLNVIGAGLRERLRGTGTAEVRVLWAWALFVVGGMAFQKTSEHWQAVVPAGGRAVPTAAFDVVQGAAVVGSAAVLLAVALALPDFLHDLRRGGWTVVRRPIAIASGATLVAVAALIALALDHDIVAASISSRSRSSRSSPGHTPPPSRRGGCRRSTRRPFSRASSPRPCS